jgi:hypothetical protein
VANRQGKTVWTCVNQLWIIEELWESRRHIIVIYTWIIERTNNCLFAGFLPLGRNSCEGPGHGHFLTCIWHLFSCPYFTLHKHMSFFSLAEIPGKRTDITRKERKYPGRVNMTKNVNMRWHCFCLLFLFLRNGLLKKLSNRISPLGRVVENVSNRLTRWRSCRNAARRLKRLEDQRTGRLGRGHGGPSGFSQNT